MRGTGRSNGEESLPDDDDAAALLGATVAHWVNAALPGRFCDALSADMLAKEIGYDETAGALTTLVEIGLATPADETLSGPYEIQSLKPVPLDELLGVADSRPGLGGDFGLRSAPACSLEPEK